VADYAYGDEAEEERISLRCGEWINDAGANGILQSKYLHCVKVQPQSKWDI
jgi:hypothetical protein